MSQVSHPSAKCIWFLEHQINTREFLRVELGIRKTHAVVDIRRWRKAPDGKTQATKKGFAISVGHLPAIIELLSAALAKAPATANNDRQLIATPTSVTEELRGAE